MSEQPDHAEAPEDGVAAGPSDDQLPGRRSGDQGDPPDLPDPAPPSAEEDDGTGSPAGAG